MLRFRNIDTLFFSFRICLTSIISIVRGLGLFVLPLRDVSRVHIRDSRDRSSVRLIIGSVISFISSAVYKPYSSCSFLNMSLSDSQLAAITAAERVTSILSVVGTTIVISTFLSSPSFRKPINRVVFFASWANILTNVGTLISRTAIVQKEHGEVLCRFQAFIIQWYVFHLTKRRNDCVDEDVVGLCHPMHCGHSQWRSTST